MRAERLGSWLGRCWRGYLRLEEVIILRLQRLNVPINLARIICWILEVIGLIVLLYVAFWITLIVLLIAAFVCGVLNFNSRANEEDSEWRDGLSGFGLYNQTGVRIDPHDPDEMP